MNTIETAGLDCVGCRSCEHACPMHAITMGEDNEGFLFPKINREICVLCGQCLKKCPVCSDNFPCSSPLEVYAFQSGDKKALMQSASGGVSDAAAEAVLQMGGVIYGAAFHTDPSDGKILSVRHVEVTDSVDRYKIRSSKYVQSDTGDSYKLARNRLKNGQTVLFTGTPCQIAGLYSFLGGDHPCLYTLDLICHGVPSPALLRQYLKSQSHCMGGSITDMNFRSKEGKGWGTQYRLKLGTESKTVSRPFVLDKYGYHFMNGNSYRESCYRCRFSGIRRRSYRRRLLGRMAELSGHRLSTGSLRRTHQYGKRPQTFPADTGACRYHPAAVTQRCYDRTGESEQTRFTSFLPRHHIFRTLERGLYR